MRPKSVTIAVILMVCTPIVGCSLLSVHQQGRPDELSAIASSDPSRSRPCAANSLYSLCRASDIPASQELCMELLPPKPEGNSIEGGA
jgi:hypothetical protein